MFLNFFFNTVVCFGFDYTPSLCCISSPPCLSHLSGCYCLIKHRIQGNTVTQSTQRSWNLIWDVLTKLSFCWKHSTAHLQKSVFSFEKQQLVYFVSQRADIGQIYRWEHSLKSQFNKLPLSACHGPTESYWFSQK